MWNRSPCELVTTELGTLTHDGTFWHGQPDGATVPVSLQSGRVGPNARMLAVAASAIARVSELEASARRYVEWLSLPQTLLGKLHAVALEKPTTEWVRREVAPRNKASADAILSGEPIVTLEFEIVGERDVLDVTFVDGAPIAWDKH